ncbi:MAG: ester cyclase [Acidimicrobiales bacterium]
MKADSNEQVVLAFLQDVLNGHNDHHAASYITADVAWHAGTLGTVTGRDDVAAVFTALVQAIPDLEAEIKDIFGHGDKVAVRLVVSGTQTRPILGIPATGHHLEWDAIDVFRLENHKIAEEWAAEDFTAILRDTGTYKAPWIP